MKKVISLVLVLVMVAALFCTPAFASYPSKSSVVDPVAEIDNDLIFFDNDEVDADGNYTCYNMDDVAAALEAMIAEVEAKAANDAAAAAQLEILKAAKVEDMNVLFLKNFMTKSGKYPVSFDLDFEGTEDASLFMLYRDWNMKGVAPSGDAKTVWTMVDAAKGPTVGIGAVNRGTVIVFVIGE